MIITITMNPAIDKTAEVDYIVSGGLNRLQNIIINPGGKGINVSKTIKSLGGDSIAMGFVAGMNGEYIVKSLHDTNIENDMIEVMGNTRVNMKVLDKDMSLTEFNEMGPTIQEKDLHELCKRINYHIRPNDIVVLSGSVPSGVAKDIYAKIICDAKQKQAKVILDADGDLFKEAIEEIPNVIKPNIYELCQYFGLPENCHREQLIEAGEQLLKKGVELLVISMGSEGAIFMNKDHYALVDALKVKAHSSVGAGDAMVAGIAYALENKYEFEDLIKLSLATSAGAVMTKGTQPSDYQTIQELVAKVSIQYLK